MSHSHWRKKIELGEKKKIIITHRNHGLENIIFWCGILYYRNYWFGTALNRCYRTSTTSPSFPGSFFSSLPCPDSSPSGNIKRTQRQLRPLHTISHVPRFTYTVCSLVGFWAGWCWFIVRGKHCWLAGLGWLKPTSEQAERRF